MSNFVIKVRGKFIKANRPSFWSDIDQVLTEDLQMAQIYTSKRGAQVGLAQYSKQEVVVDLGVMTFRKELHLPKKEEFEITEIKITIA